MHNQLSFYIDRCSSLHRLTPVTKLVVVLTILVVAFVGPGLFLPSALLVFVIFPAALWGKIWKPFISLFLRMVLPAISFLFIMQSIFYHQGKTSIFDFWVLSVTEEGVQFAYLISTRIAVMVSSFVVFLLSTHTGDLMVDLVKRGIPSMISYIITSSLQIIPQMRIRAYAILDAQKSRGLETEGRLINRIRSLIPLVRPLVFGSLVDVEERTIAIEARGFTYPGKKTSIKEINDTSNERLFRWFCLVIIILTIGSRIWLS